MELTAADLGHGDDGTKRTNVGRFAPHVRPGHEEEGRGAKDEVEIIRDEIHIVLDFDTGMASFLELTVSYFGYTLMALVRSVQAFN